MPRSAVEGVEAVEAETRHVFARHTHEKFGIGVIHRGAQRSLSGRGIVEAGPGDVITVNPGEVHDGAPIGDAGRAWSILYFEPAILRAASDDISQGSAFEFTLPVMRDAGLGGRFRELFSLFTGGEEETLALRRDEALLLMVAKILRGGGFDAGPAGLPRAIWIARSLIDDDPTAPVTLACLARESGLGRFQLVRSFARATGFTPHAYLVQRRIDMARRLIAQGTPLAEAAAASGFAHQSHMTRIFVRKYGVSPGAYAGALT